MNTRETTIGQVTSKEEAEATAWIWYSPSLGFHTQVVAKDNGFIVRLVIND
jgi:hypothetical protein